MSKERQPGAEGRAVSDELVWNEKRDREEAPNYGRQMAGDGMVVMRIGVTRCSELTLKHTSAGNGEVA